MKSYYITFKIYLLRQLFFLVIQFTLLFFLYPFAVAGDNIYYIDRDGDGYGVGVEYVLGPDADDSDPEINTVESVFEKYPSLTAFLEKKGYASNRILYISSKGNDDTGIVDDILKPFLSWRKASSIVRPGDTIIFREGLYKELINLKNFKGTMEEPINFMAYPGEKVIFEDCGGSGNSAGISVKGGSYINIDGFIFDNKENLRNGNGVYLNGSTKYDWNKVHDIRVKNVEVTNTKSGIRAMVNIHNLVIEDCVIHDTSSHNIYVGTSNNNLINMDIFIKNNLLYRGAQKYKGRFCIQHNGIVDGLIIENNICHSNETGGGISLENGSLNSIIRNNLIFNNAKMGIQIYGYKAKWGGPFKNNQIINNTIWVGSHSPVGGEGTKDYYGILLKDNTGNFSISGTVIQNNIISTQSGYPIYIYQKSVITTTVIENNIFYRKKDKKVIKLGENVYKLKKAAKKHRLVRNNIFADPKFKDVSIRYYNNPQKFNFDILKDSPAINFILAAGLEKDVAGHTRSGKKHDVGCYEFTDNNSPPVFNKTKEFVVFINEKNQLNLTAMDINKDNISFNCLNIPKNANLTGSVFNWNPVVAQTGEIKLFFTVSDGLSEDRMIVKCHVIERDHESPTIKIIEPLAKKEIKIIFDDMMDEKSLMNLKNYQINRNMKIHSAKPQIIKSEVVLTTSDHVIGKRYKLTVKNVKDLSQNKINPIEKEYIFNPLKGHWKFDTTADNIAYDSSSLKSDGLLINVGKFPGKINGGIKFSGKDSYVIIKHKKKINPVKELTLTFWLYWEGNIGNEKYQGIINKKGVYDLFMGKENFYCRISDSMLKNCGKLNRFQWYHISLVYNYNADQIVYINGEQKYLKKATGELPFKESPILIGARKNYFLNGVLDDLRIYNAALSKSEIMDIYYDN